MNRYDKIVEIPLTNVQELHEIWKILDQITRAARSAKKAADVTWRLAKNARYEAEIAHMRAEVEEREK